MTYKENVRAILECNFAGFSDDVIDSAVKKIMELHHPKGRWIIHPKGIYANLVCSRCLTQAPYNSCTNYCSKCGADMHEGREYETD